MSFRRPFAWVALCGVAVAAFAVSHSSAPQASAQPAKAAAPDEFGTTVVPFLESYCYGCHNNKDNAGGVSLEGIETAAHAKKDRKTWEMVERVLMDGSMPPKERKKQPKKEERSAVAAYLGGTLLKVSCVGPKDPGRVTMRRLNRAEYNNTVRDLCGVSNFRPADDFPSDDVGYGFDNIGDVLSVQPILVEKYMAAADKVLEEALRPLPPVAAARNTFRPQNLLAFPRGSKSNEGGKNRILLTAQESSAYMDKLNFPLDGEYAVRAKVWTIKSGDAPAKAVLRVDGKDLQTFEVTAAEDKAAVIEFKGKFAAGEKRVAVAFANPFADKDEKKRTLGVDFLEIEGPLGKIEQPQTKGRLLVLGEAAKDAPKDKDKKAAAEKVLSAFARRAYRRPVKKDEVARLVKLFDVADARGDKFEEAIKLPLKAVLCSPNFLFRVEDDPKPPATTRPLNDHELATRLSYFLWSSMPDDELAAVADKGELRKPAVLEAQVKRMLADWKAQSLTQDFAGQWLMLRSVWGAAPDAKLFPAFDDKLKASMVRETEEYFTNVVKGDRSVMELLDSDYTFLDERLARHYGVKGVFGDRFREVKLTDGRRGGVLTHASVLTVTSNPTRTSPVKRGKWVLENLLASPPPPAPPNVPELEKTELKGTLRQQMEQHRLNPACANCHAKMDAIGFGLENFDAVGAWRDADGKNKVDASGVLPGDQKFDGPAELRKILMAQGDKFRRCLAEKLLTFALGRGLEYYDKCALDDLVTKLKAGNDKFSALVMAIVQSEPFLQRTAKRTE
jgi:mono/diheme cytochrome c family protein